MGLWGGWLELAWISGWKSSMRQISPDQLLKLSRTVAMVTLGDVWRIRFQGDSEATATAEARFTKWLINDHDEILPYVAIDKIADTLEEALTQGRNWNEDERQQVMKILAAGIERWAMVAAADPRLTSCAVEWKKRLSTAAAPIERED